MIIIIKKLSKLKLKVRLNISIGDEGSQAPAEKSVIDEAVKSSAEKNLKS